MYAVDDQNQAIPMKNLKTPDKFKPLQNHLAWKIYLELSKNPMCPNDLAKKLGANAQNVYYHVKQLRKAGLIKVLRTEERHGATAKIYGAKPTVLAVVPEIEFEKVPVGKISSASALSGFLKPFISDGRLNCKIIVGSPDPHGKYRARASDACCAIDLSLFIGSLVTTGNFQNYKLDTEVREGDLNSNLILIGGPKANIITAQIESKLPIQMREEEDWNLVSKTSGQVYSEDENGFIAKIDSPWNKESRIIVIAGKRFSGTRAAVLAFVKHFEEVSRGNRYDSKIAAKVVKGVDVNSDGIVDEVEFLE